MNSIDHSDGESGQPPEKSDLPQRVRWSRRRMIVVTTGVLFGALIFFVASSMIFQLYMGPKVDASLTKLEVKSEANLEGQASSEPLPGILAPLSNDPLEDAVHPLDPFLVVAKAAKEKLLAEVADYSAVLMNEVRTPKGNLREPQFVRIKVRHARDADQKKIPFSIYTCFLKPASLAGQEAIWIEGQNDGNLIAHPAFLNFKRFSLDPKGSIAMGDNRYPIFEIGMERLLNQIIEKGERDRKHGDCQVSIDRGIEVNGRKCLRITICHPEKIEPFDFHRAIIYVDIERQWPMGYEGFDFPDTPGGEPVLIERYFYSEIKVNNGFTDLDWDPDNPEYKFPGF